MVTCIQFCKKEKKAKAEENTFRLVFINLSLVTNIKVRDVLSYCVNLNINLKGLIVLSFNTQMCHIYYETAQMKPS